MNKMINTAKFINAFVKVIQILAIIAIILCAILCITSLISPSTITNFLTNSVTRLNFGSMSLELNDKGIALLNDNINQLIILSIIPSIIMMIMINIGCIYAKKIISPIKNGETPFYQGNHQNIFKLGWTLLIGGLLQELCMQISFNSMINIMGIENFFNTNLISNITMNQSYSLSPVLVSVVVFLLGYIFKYGEQLQKESDETL